MRVLLLSENSEDNKFFPEAVAAAGFTFSKVTSPVALCDELEKEPTSLAIIDASTPALYEAFEKTVSERFGLYSAVVNPNNFFFVASIPFHETPYLVKSEIFGHFIHRTFSPENVPLIEKVLRQAAAEKGFGLEKYFAPNARVNNIQITKSLQKKVLVESLKTHLIQIGFKARMAAVISTAADELIMNAIFDAPTDESGRHTHTQIPRNAALELTGKSIVEMKVIYDGVTLGLSVADNHGSLDKKKLLSQHIGKSYVTNEYETRTTTLGAGLGLAHVYRNCGGIVFLCENGHKTEVMLFFKKTDSFRAFKDQFRFLSTMMYFT